MSTAPRDRAQISDEDYLLDPVGRRFVDVPLQLQDDHHRGGDFDALRQWLELVPDVDEGR